MSLKGISSSTASMMRHTLSRMVLLWGILLPILLWASCANVLHTSSDIVKNLSTSLPDGDPHVLNLRMHNRDNEDVLRADSHKLNPLCSKGSLTYVYQWLHEAKDKKQGGPESPLDVCCHKQNKGLLKGDANHVVKARRPVGIRDSKFNVLSFFVLHRKFRPIARDEDLVQRSINEGAQVPKQGSVQIWEPLLICTLSRGLSERNNISYSMRILLSWSATSKATVLGDHVQGNIQVQEFPRLSHGRHFSARRRQLLQAVILPVVAPVVAPVPAPAMSPDYDYVWVPDPAPAPAPMTPVLPVPPPPNMVARPPPFASPPPPNMVTRSPPFTSPPPPNMVTRSPPFTSPPPPPFTPTSQSTYFPSPPPPPPPSPPIVYLDFPPGELDLLQPTINGPDVYNIANVSVFITGVDLPFLNITPSSILLLKVAALQEKGDHVVELPRLHDGRQNPGRVRRLFQATPTQVVSSGVYIKTSTAWQPKTSGVSQQLLLILQVDAGSLVILLPGYLLYNTKHQPTMADEWVSTMNSSDPWVWVPGAGIQFLGTVKEINAALSTLMFGLGLGTGKSRTCNLLVLASHTYQNLTSITDSEATKLVTLNVAGAGAWFAVFTYTKTFYQSSVGVLCFFALLLIFLCCILGCCVCHDAKMEKVFQQNKTVLKAQNVVFNDTRVFNPVWIPSAAVGSGRGKFVVIHNPKFLQQRLAEHLSSLHGAVAEKVASVLDFRRRSQAEESLGLRDSGSDDSDPFASMLEEMSRDFEPVTSPAEASEDDGAASQSTHYTIKDDRQQGSPFSGREMSPGSNSTHYDIGSSESASGSDETESTHG